MTSNYALVGGAGFRRRAVSAISICLLHHVEERERLRGPNYERRTFHFYSYVAGVTPRLFKRTYRMNRNDFEALCTLLSVRDSRIPVSTRLSMTLRWLAGGSYLDISLSHHVATSSFYHVVDKTLMDLNEALKINFNFRDAAYLNKISAGFSRHGRSPLSGCVGALDGIAIKIQEPCRGSIANPSTYYNRKGFFELSVQSMCDSRYCFTFASAICPGSTHD
jgi:DDE superfamily endonuclease